MIESTKKKIYFTVLGIIIIILMLSIINTISIYKRFGWKWCLKEEENYVDVIKCFNTSKERLDYVLSKINESDIKNWDLETNYINNDTNIQDYGFIEKRN